MKQVGMSKWQSFVYIVGILLLIGGSWYQLGGSGVLIAFGASLMLFLVGASIEDTIREQYQGNDGGPSAAS
jgi:hypothetical protein